MTTSFVSFQGSTFTMTRVTFPNCLTSGVHLNRSVTVRSNCTLAFVFNKALWGVGVVAEGRRQRAVESGDPVIGTSGDQKRQNLTTKAGSP